MMAVNDCSGTMDHLIPDSLVIPFAMIVRHVLRQCALERRSAKENHSANALLFDRANEPLCKGIQVGRPRRQTAPIHRRR
jgi:hypothetical protein